jgi:uncharacterized RDD family membrane protein YckC
MTNTDAPVLRPTPAITRRLAAFLYEGVLLFGVVMIAGYLYSALTQQRHALEGRTGQQLFQFLILGVYFVWFWSHGGQTVAMKTWHLRLQMRDGSPVSQVRALGRYLLSWSWFVVPLGVIAAHGGRTPDWALLGWSVFLGIVAYAGLSRFLPERQFLHDLLCGTRIVDTRPVKS